MRKSRKDGKMILDNWILKNLYLSADNLIISIETTKKKLTVNIQIPEIFSFEYVFSNVYNFSDVILFSKLSTLTYKYQKKFKMQSIKMQPLMQVLHPDLKFPQIFFTRYL